MGDSLPGISDKSANLGDYLVSTREVEQLAGIQLWDKLRGTKGERLKDSKARMWSVAAAKKAANKRKAEREAAES